MGIFLRFLVMLTIAMPLPAFAVNVVRFDGHAVQGGLLRGTAPRGSRLTLEGYNVRIDAAGNFILGFARDAKAAATLHVTYADGRKESRRIAVAPRTYDIQRIDGLPEGMVTPSTPETLARITRERKEIGRARAVDSDLAGFLGPFVWPADGIRSGVYGSQRILNGQPRAPHLGTDVAAPVGTPVRAMADGVVRLAAPDLYFTGGTVMLDHGHGLGSLYAHLSKLSIQPGDTVRQGEEIGLMGRTGRATGPHVHWGVYWFDRALDPEPLVPARPVDARVAPQVAPAAPRSELDAAQ